MHRLTSSLLVFIFLLGCIPSLAQTSSRVTEKTISVADSQGVYHFHEGSQYVYSDGRGSDMNIHDYHFDTSWTEMDTRGNFTQRVIKSYYADQRLKETVYQLVSQSQWVNYKRQLYYYHSVNLLDSLIEQHWNGFNRIWGAYSASRFQYNSQGKIVEEKKQSWNLSAYEDETRTLYDYMGGHLQKKESFYYDFIISQWVATEKVIYLNTAGQLNREEWSYWDTSAKVYIPNRALDYRWKTAQLVDSTMEWQWDTLKKVWMPRYLHTYGYDMNLWPSADTLFHFDAHTSLWAPSYLQTQAYDSSGNLIEKMESMNLSGLWKPRFRWTWTYNSFDQPLVEESRIWVDSSQQWVPRPAMKSRIEYQYEIYGPVGLSTVPKENPFQLYPNPADRHLIIEIPQPPSSKIEAVLVDMQGKALKKWEIHPQKGVVRERMELDSIPQGNYLLRMRWDQKEFSQKVTIQR